MLYLSTHPRHFFFLVTLWLSALLPWGNMDLFATESRSGDLIHIHHPNDKSMEVVNGYKIVRGERPPIAFNTKDTAAWRQNVLIIKFERDLEAHFKDNPVQVNKAGIVTFGLAAVDSLNTLYGVAATTQYFLSPALHNTFTERHKAWGFHLWYQLETTSKTDILTMMQSYAALPEIEITTPSFIKILHEMPPAALPAGTAQGQNGQSLLAEPAATLGKHPLQGGEVSPVNATKRGRGSEWIPDDPLYGNQWAFKNTGQFNGRLGADIGLPRAHEIEKGDTIVLVAVVDGGIDLNHEDIAGNIWYQTGYNFVHNSSVIEPHNHGTLVAGIVGATNNNGTGVASVAGGSGQNDGVRLMTAQVFAQSGAGGFHTAQVYAADNGAAISQNSWGYGTPGHYNPAILDAFDYFNAHGGGVVMEGGIIFSSAGNSNDNGAYYPGYYSGVFSVTGTGNRDEKAWYSNYGSYIDIAAPGGETNIVTQRGVLTTHNNNNYGYSQGTSVSCPFASGTAALLLSYAYRNNHILANSEVWAFMTENTDDINPYNPNYQDMLGSGRLNAHKVLLAAEDIFSSVTNPRHLVAQAATDDYLVDLSWSRNADDDDVMIVWTTNNNFGTPEEGALYAVGDNIRGGGKVIFRGSDTLFTHTGLDEHTTNYYRAYSFNSAKEYSFGRNTWATTLGGNLRIVGLNKGYSSIPAWQMPGYIELKARVENTGLWLTRESQVLFTVEPAGFSGSASIPLPFGTGDETEVVAAEPWITAALETGSYLVTWEADHYGSAEGDKVDSFVLHVTDSVYARDSGSITNGIGSNSGPVTLGMLFEINETAIFTGIQIQWPNNTMNSLEFKVALYEVNDALGIVRTAYLSDMLTRTPEMQNTTHSFLFKTRPAVIDPGTYMLAFKQLTDNNLMVGFDEAPHGSFYRSNQAVNPGSFPHQHFGYGHLALRMLLKQPENVTGVGNTYDGDSSPAIWVYGNVLFVDNPHGDMHTAVYDISGRRLYSFRVHNGANSFPLNLPAGIYVINTDHGSVTHPTKVVIY